MFGGVPSTHMLALCDSLTVLSPALSCSHHRIGSVGVRGVIEQSTNVMNKQRIQKLGDFLLVCKVQCAVKWYPEVPRVSLNEGEGSSSQGTATYHTPLRCIGPIFTTCRTFSLFKIPSRLPRVIPATFNSLVPLIIWLSNYIQ